MRSRLIVALVLSMALGLAFTAEATTVYTVVKNDNLSKIAADHCGSASQYRRIAADNNIANPNLIRVGQVLNINCGGAVVDTLRAVGPTQPVITSLPRSLENEGEASVTEIERQVLEVFGPDAAQTALAIFKGESGLNLRAKGYNCHYRTWTGRKVSRACKAQDRARAWSVDCGLAQINVRGQHCPARLYTLSGNLSAAKRLYDERRWDPWVVYKKGIYRQHLGQFAHVGYQYPTDTIRAAASRPTDTIRLVNTVAAIDTVQISVRGPVSLRE